MSENRSEEFDFFNNLTRSGGLLVSDSDVKKKWNEYRKAHKDRYLDLQDISLDHRDDWLLTELDLSSCNLRGTYFVGIQLAGTRFARSDLSGAEMWGATLRECNFKHAVLRKADLSRAVADAANFEKSDLRKADLGNCRFNKAKFRYADLSNANLSQAFLREADFTNAKLCDVDLTDANLAGATFKRADLRGARLTRSSLERTIFRDADLSGAHIYGAGVWNIDLDKKTKQNGLIITPDKEPAVLVDDIEVAQFIYLLLNRQKLRNVIDTVTRRGVLILGRFSDGGIELLQVIADWLRQSKNGSYLPLLFDFPRPESRTYTETIRTLAGLARFVIVDLSGPSVPQEITATVDLYDIPFVPILERKRKDWSMFKDFLVKERVLHPVRFEDAQELLGLLKEQVVIPAEKLVKKRQARLDKIFGRE